MTRSLRRPARGSAGAGRPKGEGIRRSRRVQLAGLRIDDERAMRHVEIYPRLKQLLVRDRYEFRVPGRGDGSRDWNRAVFLNLTFWSPSDPADLLVEERIPADVVAHVAWHHLAARALGEERSSVDGLLLAESIASAFDLYLVGRLLGRAPRSTFLATQVPALAEVARSAGLRANAFASLLTAIAGDPDAAFSDLRALLFRAASGLVRVADTDRAARLLDGLARHRFAPLLHHYNLSSWILAVRAHAGPPPARPGVEIARIDRALGRAPVALDWLSRHWLEAAEPSGQRPAQRSSKETG